MTSVLLEVTGMHCASCSALMEEALADQPGLVAVRVEPEAARAQVTYNQSITDVEAVRLAITELGYGASVSDLPSGP
jgi:copper chaperone CopZ